MTPHREAAGMHPAGRSLTEYGAIGDCRSAALVSRDGSLDWWCAPRFDSSSVFAALLDARRGGAWRLEADDAAAAMAYEPGTNVLVRAWQSPEGLARAWDFLPWPRPPGAPASVVVRVLEGVEGRLRFRLRFAPRPDYARAVPQVEPVRGGIVARGGGCTLLLGGNRPLEPGPGEGEASAAFELGPGERAAFALAFESGLSIADAPSTALAWAWLEQTLGAWRAWDARTSYEGPYKAAVRRSALALKLLQHEPSGGIVAAATTSLPEAVGGVRNWDYRYVWVRDAWLLAEALYMVGHPTQANSLLRWLLEACARSAPNLRIMYGLTPGSMPEEHTLDHLEGWRESRPVRVGNAAREQFQLDVYGQLLGALHACRLLGRDAVSLAWPFLRDVVEVVAQRWREPDSGIWEFRAAPRHFIPSKVMAWVALDRGVRAVREAGLEGPDGRWEAEAEQLREEVLSKGWNEELGSFVQSYGSKSLDAANLLIPLVGFLPPDDPRVVGTVERVQEELGEGPFVRRYRPDRVDDGLPGEEGAFTYCSFWLVDNLALQGRLHEARALFDALVELAGPLGLLAEMVEPSTGEQLGNYPQGFSHIGLIRSALLLEELEGRARG